MSARTFYNQLVEALSRTGTSSPLGDKGNGRDAQLDRVRSVVVWLVAFLVVAAVAVPAIKQVAYPLSKSPDPIVQLAVATGNGAYGDLGQGLERFVPEFQFVQYIPSGHTNAAFAIGRPPGQQNPNGEHPFAWLEFPQPVPFQGTFRIQFDSRFAGKEILVRFLPSSKRDDPGVTVNVIRVRIGDDGAAVISLDSGTERST